MRAPAILRLAAGVFLLLAAVAPGRGDDGPLSERVYRLTARPAAKAVERVCPLLSPRGSVEVQDNGRTLVVRDVEPALERALAALAAWDRDGRSVKLAVRIVLADASAPGGPEPAALDLPTEVVARLHRLIRYRSYALLARAEIEAPEGERTTHEIGSGFQISFRLARGSDPRRLSMQEFQVLRRDGQGAPRPLMNTHLSLETGRPMILGLSRSEASERALMVVLEAVPEGAAPEARG